MLHRNYYYDHGDDDDDSDGDGDDDHDDSQLCILCAAHSLDFVPIAKMEILEYFIDENSNNSDIFIMDIHGL